MKKWIVILLLISAAGALFFLFSGQKQLTIEKNDSYEGSVEQFRKDTVKRSEEDEIEILLDGISLKDFGYHIRLSDDLRLLCQERLLEDVMGCSIIRYANGEVSLERGSTHILLREGSSTAEVDGSPVQLETPYQYDRDQRQVYIPVKPLFSAMGYEAELSMAENQLNIKQIVSSDPLPARYDMREKGRVTAVRDQGRYGTCWAFASLGALETTLMPAEENVYSVDHMALNNSYKLALSAGGGHTMSIAYLAAWQGPVYEEDDPYDGETVDGIPAVKHLEEAIVINERDDEILKSAIYRYGGIETSLYLEMEYIGFSSDYYNPQTAAYYYSGDKPSNHDIVVVGWDDNYSKDNFAIKPEKDGAFICKNSWGEEFGEKGYFYVSYEDTNLCSQSIVYTRLEDAHNFQYIYQSDLLGWVGEMGFGKEEAFFANCYVPERDEELAGVSFYATGPSTKFSVYYVPEVKDTSDLGKRTLLVSGETRYAGYYTVKIADPPPLKKGQKYAVEVQISTPGAKRPIAVEYAADERSAEADLSDGEGYISLYGEVWNSAEESSCNICLKAFTNDMSKVESKEAGTEEGGKESEEER